MANEIKTETTAADKVAETPAEKMTLSAAGVADALKSELELPGQEEPDAKEIPAEEIPDEIADPENVETGEVAEPEKGEADEATEAAAHTAEVQSELDKWAETGGPMPPALQAVVGKRIGKLTTARDAEKARADKAETELTQAKAEAEALRNDPKRPAQSAPSPVMDEKTVAQLTTTAKTMSAEIENYLDDSASDEERARVERYMETQKLDAKGLKRELKAMEKFVAEEVPKLTVALQTFRQQEAANEPIAKARFPWLDAKDTPEYQKAQQVSGFMPELRTRIPGHRAALGTWVVGLKVIEALNAAGHEGDALAALQPLLTKAFPPKNGKAKPAATTPPPKSPAHGSAPPVKTVARKDDAARNTFNKAPTRENAVDLARAALRAS